MNRLDRAHIWALVASIVCGIGIASLLSGSRLPLGLIVIVVLLGLGATALRRRKMQAYLPTGRAPRLPEPPRGAERAEDAPREVAPPTVSRRTSPRGLRGLPVDEERRAGARFQSLGGRPPADDEQAR